MKKLLWSITIVIILCISVFLSGCGKTEANKTQPSTGLTVETTEEKGFQIESTVKPAEPVDVPQETNAETEKTTQATKTTTATVQSTSTAIISQGDAQRIALDHAGVTERQATPTKVELDVENGKQIYEIDFIAGNMEYEYDINAETGAIISADKELHDNY